MNSKLALFFVIVALALVALYVVKAKQRRLQSEMAPAVASESTPAPPHAKSAEPPKRPRN